VGVVRVLSRVAVLVVGAWLRLMSTPRHRRAAERAADARFPGLLRVVGSRTLFPASTGSEIAFALADDPDAVARARIERSTVDVEATLADAVATARVRADRLRALLAAFAPFPVVAVDQDEGRPWVAVDLTGDADARLRELGACARALTAHRMAVVVVPPSAASALPADDLPTPLRLGSPDRLRALRAPSVHVVSL
jgi:hypothetical protein